VAWNARKIVKVVTKKQRSLIASLWHYTSHIGSWGDTAL